MNSSLVQSALYLATKAHEGQIRRGWHDYILHPVAVAISAMAHGMSDACVACALLHDVVEDTSVTFVHLEALPWMTEEMLDILHLLTKVKGETSQQHLKRILASDNINAIKLKRLDLEHNSYVHPYDSWDGMEEALYRYKVALEAIEKYLEG